MVRGRLWEIVKDLPERLLPQFLTVWSPIKSQQIGWVSKPGSMAIPF
jgi:hypothetical protein